MAVWCASYKLDFGAVFLIGWFGIICRIRESIPVVQVIDTVREPVDAQFKVQRDHVKHEISGKSSKDILKKYEENGSHKRYQEKE